MDSKELARAVAKRERQIKKYVEFALWLIDQIGKITSREQRSSHTNVVRSVLDFGGFCFRFDSGMTMMGGNEVVITATGNEGWLLNVYWQVGNFNVNECKVHYFSPDSPWIKILDKVIRNKESVMAKIARSGQTSKTRLAKVEERAKAEVVLSKKAERLNLGS